MRLKYIAAHPSILCAAAVAVISILALASAARAATTISTDISTGGALSVTGNSTLTGSVGIGTSTPAAKLGVQGSAFISGNLTVAGITATSSSIVFSGLGTDILASINSSGTLVTTSTPTASHYLATSTTATSTFAGGAVFATSGGSVGIGTTSPYAKLSIVGEVVARKFTATSTSATTTFSGGLVVGSNGIIYAPSSGSISLNYPLNSNYGFTVSANLDASSQLFRIIDSSDIQVFDIIGDIASGDSIISLGDVGGSENKVALRVNEQAQSVEILRGSLAIGNGTATSTLASISGKLGIGTSSPASLLHVSAGASATTTVEFGGRSTSARTCFNVRDALGAATSFYFVGTTIVVEANYCR